MHRNTEGQLHAAPGGAQAGRRLGVRSITAFGSLSALTCSKAKPSLQRRSADARALAARVSPGVLFPAGTRTRPRCRTDRSRFRRSRAARRAAQCHRRRPGNRFARADRSRARREVAHRSRRTQRPERRIYRLRVRVWIWSRSGAPSPACRSLLPPATTGCTETGECRVTTALSRRRSLQWHGASCASKLAGHAKRGGAPAMPVCRPSSRPLRV